MSKPNATPPAPAAAQDQIAPAIEVARAALVSVSAGLLELTPTAKQGIRSAEDAIAHLERGLSLVRWVVLSQADVARRRSDRDAVDKSLSK